MNEDINIYGFENLGGNRRPKDKRDLGLAEYQEPITIPSSFSHDLSTIPVLHQGKRPACGSHAGAILDSALTKKTLSPKYLWKQIKLIDGYAPEQGTDLRSIMKSLSKTGDCSIELSPNDLDDTLEEYTDPSTITQEQRDDADKNKIGGYAFINRPSWDDVCRAIYTNKVVIALVECGDGWWKAKNGNNSWNEKDILPLRLGTYVSGHFVVLYGYDEEHIYFRNSWSNSWGKNGNGYFNSSYLPYVYELGTAIQLPDRFIFKNNLWFGKKHDDNIELQKRLGVSPTDRNFGPKTLAAVVKYQKANNITPTGYCGPITRARLNTQK